MQITREGKGLLLTTMLVSLAALNTGNNLIYLLLSLMISLIVVDMIAGFRNMGGLKGHADTDGPVFAGQPAGLTFRIQNSRSRRPAFLVGARWDMVNGAVVVPRVDPGGQAAAEAVVRFPRRGLYHLQDGFVFSAFPFGFFRTTRPMSDRHRIMVYPALVEVRTILSRLSRSGGAGVIPLPDGDDFTDLRPYRPGDRMKDIHWKATAKRGDMMVREFRAGISHRVNLILDTAPESAPPHFERAVSIAASIALHLIKQGLAVRLITGTSTTDFCGDREAACRILDTLAIVQPDVSARVPEEPGEGAINILVLCRKSSPFALLRPSMTETIHVPTV